MFRFKSLVTLGTIALLGLAACTDVTGPAPKSGFCPITGGPGTCDDPGIVAHR